MSTQEGFSDSEGSFSSLEGDGPVVGSAAPSPSARGNTGGDEETPNASDTDESFYDSYPARFSDDEGDSSSDEGGGGGSVGSMASSVGSSKRSGLRRKIAGMGRSRVR